MTVICSSLPLSFLLYSSRACWTLLNRDSQSPSSRAHSPSRGSDTRTGFCHVSYTDTDTDTAWTRVHYLPYLAVAGFGIQKGSAVYMPGNYRPVSNIYSVSILETIWTYMGFSLHLIMDYYPLFRVRSCNNGMRCMSFYILVKKSCEIQLLLTLQDLMTYKD